MKCRAESVYCLNIEWQRPVNVFIPTFSCVLNWNRKATVRRTISAFHILYVHRFLIDQQSQSFTCSCSCSFTRSLPYSIISHSTMNSFSYTPLLIFYWNIYFIFSFKVRLALFILHTEINRTLILSFTFIYYQQCLWWTALFCNSSPLEPRRLLLSSRPLSLLPAECLDQLLSWLQGGK